jgi:glutamate dehydrogenase
LLNSFSYFNQSVVKTNFYKEEIGAVGYRLDPSIFMKLLKVPEIPFGIFHIIGRDFNGFHVRFRDISRGGIRMILSTSDNYARNQITQFQENYGLAYTQKLKNKDITESGSKGTILMRYGKNH